MIVINRDRLKASICKDSFYEFVLEMWDTINVEPIVDNWHIRYLCDEMQTAAERVFRGEPKEYDLAINISPGSSKSTICSIMLCPWVWTNMIHARLLHASYAHMLALDLSRRSRMIIQSEKYAKYYPQVILSDDQNTKSFFANTAGGGRLAVGIGGSVTGFHGHFLGVDDPLDPNGSVSEEVMKTANRWMNETLPTRKIDKEGALTVLIQQRLHEDDSTGNVLKRNVDGSVKHICIPAELTEDVNPPELAKNYIDGLMDPVRLSRKALENFQKELGEYMYSHQFLQRAMPRTGGMFKVQELRAETAPPNTSFPVLIRYWDKAGSHKKGAWTVGVLMGRDKDGVIWILDVVRGQWDSHEREKVIKSTAQMDGRRVIVYVEQEPGSGGKESAENTIRNLQGYRVRAERPTGDKVLRADPFSTQVNGGWVRMKKAEWNADYRNELKYFPNSKFKDQVDASSGAFTNLTKRKKKAGGI